MAAGEEKLKLVLDAIDRTAAPIRKVNRRIETMLAPIRKVKRAMRALAVESGLPKLGQSLKGIGRIARRFAFVGVAAFGALGAAVVRVSSQGDKLAKFAKQVGIGVEALQEFEFAADRSGVSSEVFRQSVGALAKRVGELKAGKGALATLLGAVAPNVAKRLKSTTDTAEALQIILETIDKVKDPLKKSALAAAAFSRAGLTMVNLANEGAAGLQTLKDRARELGLVLSDEMLADAEKTTDALTDLKASTGGLFKTITSGLFPVVQEIADRITKWTIANRELIQVKAKEAIESLVAAGRKVLTWLREVIPPTLEFIDSIGGLKTIAIVVGVILAATLLPAIVAIGTAIVTIGGLFISAGVAIVAALGLPGLAIAALVALFAGAAVAIAKNWDSVKETIVGTIDAIIAKARGLIPRIPAPVRRLFGLEDGPGGEIAPVAVAGAGAVRTVESAAAAVVGGPGTGGKSVLKVEVEDKRIGLRVIEADPELELDTEGGEALAAG